MVYRSNLFFHCLASVAGVVVDAIVVSVVVLGFGSAFASTRRENMDKQTLEGELLRYLYVDGNTGE